MPLPPAPSRRNCFLKARARPRSRNSKNYLRSKGWAHQRILRASYHSLPGLMVRGSTARSCAPMVASLKSSQCSRFTLKEERKMQNIILITVPSSGFSVLVYAGTGDDVEGYQRLSEKERNDH